ncbi:rCG43775 [Rattus norvegicus]|uniref:RCG43775 n=1 Tax=Rattus norvegicus TaxID=10116 RepID=A6KUB8_RAT|nr:rCG43775 [Rattus norvegicus]
MEKLGTESLAGISPASHSRGRLGSGLRSQQLQRPSRRRDLPARSLRSPWAMPPSAPPRPFYNSSTQIPITRQAGSSRRRPAELWHPPGEAWAPVRGRCVPRVPRRKELERSGAEQHFTLKFPSLNRLELSLYSTSDSSP